MKILFVCKNNQFRSQMAASLYNKITGTDNAYSAGTYVGSVDVPEGTVIERYFRAPDFFEIMEENGMNIRKNITKKILPEMIDNANIVVSMVEEQFVPDFLRNNEKIVWWEVENPVFVTRNIAEKTYSQIKKMVEQLINSVDNL